MSKRNVILYESILDMYFPKVNAEQDAASIVAYIDKGRIIVMVNKTTDNIPKGITFEEFTQRYFADMI